MSTRHPGIKHNSRKPGWSQVCISSKFAEEAPGSRSACCWFHQWSVPGLHTDTVPCTMCLSFPLPSPGPQSQETQAVPQLIALGDYLHVVESVGLYVCVSMHVNPCVYRVYALERACACSVAQSQATPYPPLIPSVSPLHSCSPGAAIVSYLICS